MHSQTPNNSQRPDWAFALHGGAGAVAGRDYRETEAHLAELAGACRERLAGNTPALDVVEFAVAEMESSGMYVAGKGSAPNTAGYVELDASIMDGASREAGAVAAIVGVVNPISVARGVLRATPHVMLGGQGARVFAELEGFELVENPDNYYVLPVGIYEHEIHEQKHGTVGPLRSTRLEGWLLPRLPAAPSASSRAASATRR